MPVASGVDAFDGASAQPTPVRSSVAKGANATAPAVPSMTGTPPLSKHNPLATGATTLQAPDTRATTSPLKATRAAVDAFDGSTV